VNSGDFTKTGWNIGGGLAYGLTSNLVIGADYKHIDFGQADVSLGYNNCNGCAGYEEVRTHVRLDEIEARMTFKTN